MTVSDTSKRGTKGSGWGKRLVRIIEVLVLVFAIGVLGTVIFRARQGGLVEIFGHSLLMVETGSMAPSFDVGDYIWIKEADPASLHKNDVIAYYSEDPEIAGMLVTHRIVKVNEDGTFTVRGDANSRPDDLAVRPDRVAGVYSGRARIFDWLGSFGDARKLVLLLAIILFFFMSLYEVRTLNKAVKAAFGKGETPAPADAFKGSVGGYLAGRISPAKKHVSALDCSRGWEKTPEGFMRPKETKTSVWVPKVLVPKTVDDLLHQKNEERVAEAVKEAGAKTEKVKEEVSAVSSFRPGKPTREEEIERIRKKAVEDYRRAHGM